MTGCVIRDAVVVTMRGREVLDRGWVRVEDGAIEEVGAGEPPPSSLPIVAAGGRVLLPGLVSAHQHLLDVLAAAADIPPEFLDWLFGTYYGCVRAMTPDDCGLATFAAGATSLRAGITTVVDVWGLDPGSDRGRVRAGAEASIDAHRRLGLRTVFARMFATRLPAPWRAALDGATVRAVCGRLDEQLADAAALMADHDDPKGLLRVTLAPELVEMVGFEGVRAARALAAERGVVLPLHLLTSPESRAAAPASRLEAEGLLGSDVLAAHCTAATSEDLHVLARQGVALAHCPTANAALGGAVSVRPFLDAGLRVGLGADNASLNPHPDVLAEASTALLNAGSPPLDPWVMLHAATLGGAQAIGSGDRIGSIEPGKRADLVLLDVEPQEDWATALLRGPRRVTDAWVDGRRLLDSGVVLAAPPVAGFDRALTAASDRIRRSLRTA